jgi:5-formyltetrahydrofolate cyclo-ligase
VNKSDIRKKILKIRKQKSLIDYKIDFKYILRVLKKYNIFGKTIGGYYPYNFEVDAIEILNKFEKENYQISLPKIKKNFQMDFYYWSSKEPLAINKFGIPEPTSDKILYPEILLVPLVAFDNNLNRIGYGGGYYDRYIKKAKKIKKTLTIGLAYSFQKVKKIPINKHDIKLDFIITEKII